MTEQQVPPINLDSLKEKVKNGNFSYEDFENFFIEEKEKQKEFLSLLEWACSLKKDDKNFHRLLSQVALEKASVIMEDLKNLGYGIQKDLGEYFEKSGYRLLEQTRAGKRSDVMYGITRIFITHGKNLPDVLNEAFKPYYDDETFRCFIYSFLGSVIKSKENIKEEE